MSDYRFARLPRQGVLDLRSLLALLEYHMIDNLGEEAFVENMRDLRQMQDLLRSSIRMLDYEVDWDEDNEPEPEESDPPSQVIDFMQFRWDPDVKKQFPHLDEIKFKRLQWLEREERWGAVGTDDDGNEVTVPLVQERVSCES